MANVVHVTEEGLDKLKKDLDELKFKKRPELSQKIATARDFGDLKENAEYHAAKEALGLLETKIAKLEEKIALARIIDKTDLPDDQITIFTRVKLEDIKKHKKLEWVLVPQEDADLENRKLPITSPIAKALLGKKEGDEIEVQVPRGINQYKILSFEKEII